jgi:purine-nucleoside phosphorylase
MEKIKKAKELIEGLSNIKPKVGIILGSGFSNVINYVKKDAKISYDIIEGFIQPSIEGHLGFLYTGTLNNIPVVVMSGRNHYYEGHPMKDITYPIRVMKELGIEYLVTSNAVGALNENYRPGDIMVVTDHINLMGDNPLMGDNYYQYGPRFLDMSEVYDKKLISLVENYSKTNDVLIHKGVLTALSGPCYETPSEYKWLKSTGADAVGMSTIPEAIVAHHMDIKILSFSLITNSGVKNVETLTHEKVQQVASSSSDKLSKMLNDIICYFQ